MPSFSTKMYTSYIHTKTFHYFWWWLLLCYDCYSARLSILVMFMVECSVNSDMHILKTRIHKNIQCLIQHFIELPKLKLFTMKNYSCTHTPIIKRENIKKKTTCRFAHTFIYERTTAHADWDGMNKSKTKTLSHFMWAYHEPISQWQRHKQKNAHCSYGTHSLFHALFLASSHSRHLHLCVNVDNQESSAVIAEGNIMPPFLPNLSCGYNIWPSKKRNRSQTRNKPKYMCMACACCLRTQYLVYIVLI